MESTTSLTGNPLLTVVKRSLLVFGLWFFVVVALGMVYNEMVVSETMKRLTSDRPVDMDEDEEGLPDPDYERFRFDNHQIVAFAASFGLVVVALRMLLEGVCHYWGQETCATLSGQAMIYRKNEYVPPSAPSMSPPDDEFDDMREPMREPLREPMREPAREYETREPAREYDRDRPPAYLTRREPPQRY